MAYGRTEQLPGSPSQVPRKSAPSVMNLGPSTESPLRARPLQTSMSDLVLRESKQSLSRFSKSAPTSPHEASSIISVFCHVTGDLKDLVLCTGQNMFRVEVGATSTTGDVLAEIYDMLLDAAAMHELDIHTSLPDEYQLNINGHVLSAGELVLPLVIEDGDDAIVQCQRKAVSFRKAVKKTRKHLRSKKKQASTTMLPGPDLLSLIKQSETSRSHSQLMVPEEVRARSRPKRRGSTNDTAGAPAQEQAPQKPYHLPSRSCSMGSSPTKANVGRRVISRSASSASGMSRTRPAVPRDARRVEVMGKMQVTGNARVFKAYVDGWLCAMKELSCPSSGEKAELVTNLTMLESLPVHGNVVQHLHHTVLSDSIRIFMRLYDTDLGKVISGLKARGESLSFSQIVSAAIDIASGINCLHSNSVMHRDLKCDNILVNQCSDTGKLLCAVGDLDCAKRIVGNLKATTCVGSPVYMAPEVLTSGNVNPYTSKADVYSFGMVLYEMMAMQEPYAEEPKAHIVMQMITSGILPSEPTKLPSPMRVIYGVFKSCVQMEAEARPSAQELVRIFKGIKKEVCDSL